MAGYYFAYGSNLNRSQFDRRCPAAEPMFRLTLPNFQLVFRGVADIVEAPGMSVEGAIYRITPQCEAALDRYEGFPYLYGKRCFSVRRGKGRQTEILVVMFYFMRRGAISPPSDGYLSTIEEGYNDWNIPTDGLATAVNASRAGAADECGADQIHDASEKPNLRRRRSASQSFYPHSQLMDEARNVEISLPAAGHGGRAAKH